MKSRRKEIRNFKKLDKHFEEINKKLDFFLYLKFVSFLKDKMLSAQVKNYLKGHDLDSVCKTLTMEDQKKFYAIKNLIEPTALKILKEDDEVVEIILRSAMITLLLFTFRYGKKWTKSIESSNIEKILLNNEDRYKDLDNVDQYFDVVVKFIEKHEENFLANQKEISE